MHMPCSASSPPGSPRTGQTPARSAPAGRACRARCRRATLQAAPRGMRCAAGGALPASRSRRRGGLPRGQTAARTSRQRTASGRMASDRSPGPSASRRTRPAASTSGRTLASDRSPAASASDRSPGPSASRHTLPVASTSRRIPASDQIPAASASDRSPVAATATSC
eukprot:scaffold133234_cov66-Phaeocystis_antarctica.AAC.5